MKKAVFRGGVLVGELWEALSPSGPACLSRALSPAPPSCAKHQTAYRKEPEEILNSWEVVLPRHAQDGVWLFLDSLRNAGEERSKGPTVFFFFFPLGPTVWVEHNNAICAAFYLLSFTFTTSEVEITAPISQMTKLSFRMMQGQRVFKPEPRSTCSQSCALSSDPLSSDPGSRGFWLL